MTSIDVLFFLAQNITCGHVMDLSHPAALDLETVCADDDNYDSDEFVGDVELEERRRIEYDEECDQETRQKHEPSLRR